MRTYGRTYDKLGNSTWVQVTTDANGFNDEVYVVTLAQTLKLGLGESPFYGNYGIPAYQSFMTQIAPDYYVQNAQQQYAGFFAALTVAKIPQTPQFPYPHYKLNVTTHSGAKINAAVPIPS